MLILLGVAPFKGVAFSETLPVQIDAFLKNTFRFGPILPIFSGAFAVSFREYMLFWIV